MGTLSACSAAGVGLDQALAQAEEMNRMNQLLDAVRVIEQCKTLEELRTMADQRGSWTRLSQPEQRVIEGHVEAARRRLMIRERVAGRSANKKRRSANGG